MDKVTEYISKQAEAVQPILKEIRSIILACAPEAQEHFSYGMPAYKFKAKPLVYFAAFKNHIGFYATPSGHTKFKEKLSKYKQGKGSVQFPSSEPMPYELIKEIVLFRVRENEGRVS